MPGEQVERGGHEEHAEHDREESEALLGEAGSFWDSTKTGRQLRIPLHRV
jgi:hypothetical protein